MVMVPSLRRSRICIETHGEECLSIVGFIVLECSDGNNLDCSNCSNCNNCNNWHCMPSSYL